MKRPADVYVPGRRAFKEKVKAYEYSGVYHVIKVNSWGYVRFGSWRIYLSETMIGQYIEFRPAPDGETFADHQKKMRKNFPMHVQIRTDGLYFCSVLLWEQIHTIDICRLGKLHR